MWYNYKFKKWGSEFDFEINHGATAIQKAANSADKAL